MIRIGRKLIWLNRNNIRLLTAYILLAFSSLSCQDAPATNDNQEKVDSSLISVEWMNKSSGIRNNYRIHKNDYEVICFLDTVEQNAYNVTFLLDDQHKILNLQVKNNTNKGSFSDPRKWNALQNILFNSKYSILKLKGLKALELSLTSFDFPLNLNLPASLNHLKLLTVSNSSLQSIRFDVGNHLTSLFIDHNQVTSLDKVITNLKHLNYLRIANNKLTHINIDTTYHQNLEAIDISHNPIKTPIESIRKKYPSIKIYYQSDNSNVVQ